MVGGSDGMSAWCGVVECGVSLRGVAWWIVQLLSSVVWRGILSWHEDQQCQVVVFGEIGELWKRNREDRDERERERDMC